MTSSKIKELFPRVTAKFYFEDGKVSITNKTHKTRRLYARINRSKFLKVYFKVEYGIKETNRGTKEMFFNDGTYFNKKDAIQALEAFLE